MVMLYIIFFYKIKVNEYFIHKNIYTYYIRHKSTKNITRDSDKDNKMENMTNFKCNNNQ